MARAKTLTKAGAKAGAMTDGAPSWTERHSALVELTRRQLFFIGGAPRSGTTWLQHMLDAHPEISCRGEGLFQRELAAPLDRLVAARRAAIEGKNASIFRDQAGYPLPESEDADMMLGTAVLTSLHRHAGGQACLAIGEKTPENVFLFPRLKRLFPGAKFLGIARDPRDVLASSWHMFGKVAPGQDEEAAKIAMIEASLPSLDSGLRAMLALARDREACVVVTYESLHRDPAPPLRTMLGLLDVARDDATVEACISRTTFAAMAVRQPTGPGSYLREGTVGGWRTTLTPAMNAMVMATLGWSFSNFDWTE